MGDLETVRRLVRAVVAALEAQRRRIDDLNVFPVPDGDRARTSPSPFGPCATPSRTRPPPTARPWRPRSCGLPARARGNSGVILSQMVRGAAEALAHAREIDAAAVARALRGASDAAYAAVRAPVEGTMLTVVRELAEEAERRSRERSPLGDLLHALVRAGEESVARTREQLVQLREAGVVDAGGAGLVELLRGLAAAVTGEALPAPKAAAAADIGAEALHAEPSRYRYCTTFVVEGDGLDSAAIERAVEPLGDSLLVVGDAAALKVHVHTDEPGAALTVGTRHGAISHVEINDMQRQTAERTARLEATPAVGAPAATTAAVAVYSGQGNGRLLADAGAALLVDGGETMNPSAGALLEAIGRADAPEVVVLPNDPNVQMAAERAAATRAGPRSSCRPTPSLPVSPRSWRSTPRSPPPRTPGSWPTPRRASPPARSRGPHARRA